MVKAVAAFYERVMADPALQPFFAGVDMTRQKNKQVWCVWGGGVG